MKNQSLITANFLLGKSWANCTSLQRIGERYLMWAWVTPTWMMTSSNSREGAPFLSISLPVHSTFYPTCKGHTKLVLNSVHLIGRSIWMFNECPMIFPDSFVYGKHHQSIARLRWALATGTVELIMTGRICFMSSTASLLLTPSHWCTTFHQIYHIGRQCRSAQIYFFTPKLSIPHS